jgi:hypothetical protein
MNCLTFNWHLRDHVTNSWFNIRGCMSENKANNRFLRASWLLLWKQIWSPFVRWCLKARRANSRALLDETQTKNVLPKPLQETQKWSKYTRVYREPNVGSELGTYEPIRVTRRTKSAFTRIVYIRRKVHWTCLCIGLLLWSGGPQFGLPPILSEASHVFLQSLEAKTLIVQ